METFSTFLMSNHPNAWVKATPSSTLSLYVRRTPLPLRPQMGDIQIANMINTDPGKQELHKFLDMWEPLLSFYIENTMNPLLIKFFCNRGYDIVNNSMTDIAPCFIHRSPLTRIRCRINSGSNHT